MIALRVGTKIQSQPKFSRSYLKEAKSLLYLSKLITDMDTANNKSKGLFWILFLLSVVGFFVVYASPAANFITVVIPFIGYFFVKALDII